MTLQVRLYRRPGCHLCDDARQILNRLSREFPLAIEEIDIDADPRLSERYREAIPVVEVGGWQCAGRLSEVEVRRILRQAWGRPPRRQWWSRWIP